MVPEIGNLYPVLHWSEVALCWLDFGQFKTMNAGQFDGFCSKGSSTYPSIRLSVRPSVQALSFFRIL
ncbi:hypothetical protein F7725_023870 [Dissostichus mawsoni]|uniref:Uncharacterized protein n=1 Tax=Dissostichus mawsoni TaxID=36200 RepID=A0A7J5XZA7_DISMA|nr:hypothetical protein F7725_023870 [Dissostichus mawsoni]